MVDNMARVAKMLGMTGITLANVRDTLKAEGVSEYDIYLTCKGAAMLYPHVAAVLQEERIPDTIPA